MTWQPVPLNSDSVFPIFHGKTYRVTADVASVVSDDALRNALTSNGIANVVLYDASQLPGDWPGDRALQPMHSRILRGQGTVTGDDSHIAPIKKVFLLGEVANVKEVFVDDQATTSKNLPKAIPPSSAVKLPNPLHEKDLEVKWEDWPSHVIEPGEVYRFTFDPPSASALDTWLEPLLAMGWQDVYLWQGQGVIIPEGAPIPKAGGLPSDWPTNDGDRNPFAVRVQALWNGTYKPITYPTSVQFWHGVPKKAGAPKSTKVAFYAIGAAALWYMLFHKPKTVERHEVERESDEHAFDLQGVHFHKQGDRHYSSLDGDTREISGDEYEHHRRLAT